MIEPVGVAGISTPFPTPGSSSMNISSDITFDCANAFTDPHKKIIMKINLFNIVFMRLVQMVAFAVPLNAGMKIIDDFLMLEFPIFIAPATMLVEPEYGILFGNYIFFDLIHHSFFLKYTVSDGVPRAC